MNDKNKETLSLVIKIIVAVLTGLASALGLASCMSAAGIHGFLTNL
ncbi:MAG: smalltalk protein [Bacteroidaceae bacterium]|nr:smalltalk protein [Bacteroidaceae bacterium]